ncbi:hypothetical protein HMPREF9134_01617 [Porphyromonas catoniae F0037]|uniref:Uncharacterized protein n=1 Tax=Porphyromonas catoniae F0037 TaxID=1127696 RepID=L1NA87_9PORP|nr:hypothetical protein HMPREF9134_01617 [Porphyromonas catoniae F0037]
MGSLAIHIGVGGKPTSQLWDDSFMESILEDLRNKSCIFAVLGLEGYNMPILK